MLHRSLLLSCARVCSDSLVTTVHRRCKPHSRSTSGPLPCLARGQTSPPSACFLSSPLPPLLRRPLFEPFISTRAARFSSRSSSRSRPTYLILPSGGDFVPPTISHPLVLVWRNSGSACPLSISASVFPSSSTTRDYRAQTQISTSEHPNLRQSTPPKKSLPFPRHARKGVSFVLASILHLPRL